MNPAMRYDYEICNCPCGPHLERVECPDGNDVRADDYLTLARQAVAMAEMSIPLLQDYISVLHFGLARVTMDSAVADAKQNLAVAINVMQQAQAIMAAYGGGKS